MYNEYFGLKESPFSIAPDPRYLYMSEQHREALAHLVYGFNSDGGFVLLTGEVGTGKTTVCRCLLNQIPENTSIAFILNPKLSVQELLAAICDEFGITYDRDKAGVKVFVDLINAYLLDAHAKGRRTVLIIDEAQNLSAEVLEQLRLLTNLETNQRKLLQIILIGQPELREKLSRPELRQLSQRIIARYHLGMLSKKEIGAYVSHRLSVAGLQDQLFPQSTLNKLYRLSGGVPRLINVLSDRALLGTYIRHKHRVDTSTLKEAAREVFGELKPRGAGRHRKAAAWILSAFLLIAVGVVLASTFYEEKHRKSIVHEAAAPEVSEDIQLDDLQWPDGQPVNKSAEMAFQDLFSLWGEAYHPAENSSPCDKTITGRLACYQGLGSLHILRNLNRPAVLTLSANNGSKYHAVLTSLKDNSAEIIIGRETREVSLEDIEMFWLGEYTLLWQPPAEYQGFIKPGDKNPLVPWLDKQLAIIDGDKVRKSENLIYDSDLVKRVTKFQISEGLVPDGIIGTQTLIHLNTATGTHIPALTEKRKDI